MSVKETLCTSCVHLHICSLKETFLKAQEAVDNCSMYGRREDGMTKSTHIQDLDFIAPITLSMTINEYQRAALRTEAPKGPYMTAGGSLRAFILNVRDRDLNGGVSLIRLLEGVMGLCGEAGEIDDILKKVLFQGHMVDREHMALELGDIAWYLALAADAIGYDLETIMKMNIDKLYARYPDGFEVDKSVNRKEGDI